MSDTLKTPNHTQTRSHLMIGDEASPVTLEVKAGLELTDRLQGIQALTVTGLTPGWVPPACKRHGPNAPQNVPA